MVLCIILSLMADSDSQCFQMNQKIIGSQATLRLQVILQPKKQEQLSSFCSTLTGISSYLRLNFLNFNNSLIPNSDNTTLNMTEKEIIFDIYLVDNGQTSATSIYQSVASQKEAMYSITFLNNIELAGTIYSISFRNLDATNCWNSGAMQYYFNTLQSYLQIYVEPNDCAISTQVSVQLQYKTLKEDNWNIVNIPPYKLLMNDPSYYNNDKNYQHLKVKNFRVSPLISYTGPNAQQEVEKFFNMIQKFQQDRSFQFRLVLYTTDQGIQQQYYYDLTQWSGVNETCFDFRQVYLQPDSLIIVINEMSEECVAKLNKSEYMKVTIYVNNTAQVQNFQHIEYTTPCYFLNANIFHINFEENWELNTTPLQYYVYLTFCKTLDKPQLSKDKTFYLDEIVYSGNIQKSCITQMNLALYSSKICVSMYVNPIKSKVDLPGGRTQETYVCARYLQLPVDNSNFIMLYETERYQPRTRHYTMYASQNLPKNISLVNHFCFKETTPKDRQYLINGSLQKRSIQEVNMLHKYGPNQSYAYFLNDKNCYIIDTITFKLPIYDYMWLVPFCCISVSIASVFVYLQVKRS